MRLWGGRFSGTTDERVAEFTRSVELDRALAIDDIAGSVAHVHGLGRAGLLTTQEVTGRGGGGAGGAAGRGGGGGGAGGRAGSGERWGGGREGGGRGTGRGPAPTRAPQNPPAPPPPPPLPRAPSL